MNEKDKQKLTDDKALLEYRKWIEEIEHNLETRSHWKERAKAQDNQWLIQNHHWDKQQKYWNRLYFAGIAAMLLTALVAIFFGQ